MEMPKYKNALIVGAGEGLSASLARLLSREGIKVALAARKVEKLGALCTETGAKAFACDATNADDVERLFGLVEREIGVSRIWSSTMPAGGRAAPSPIWCRPMWPRRSRSRRSAAFWWRSRRCSACCRTGTAPSCSPAPPPASRAIRSRRRSRWASSRCAAWPRAWRANCRRRASISRISSSTAASAAPREPSPPTSPNSMLDPDAIALSYWNVLQQPRSAWTWELELRPWVEKF